MRKLEIEYMPIGELKPYENNAKLHPKEQIEQIKNSISQFGMNDPIAISSKDNIIIEGHGRLLACKELRMKSVPVIRLDHLNEEQRKAYTLAHNKLTMNTGFDIDKLHIELQDITLNMTDFGFDEVEDIDLDSFFEDVGEKEKEDKKEAITCPFCHKEFVRE